MELLGGGNIAISSLGLYSFPQLAASEAGISNAYDPSGREIARNFSSLSISCLTVDSGFHWMQGGCLWIGKLVGNPSTNGVGLTHVC